jgi:hypothetical protein
MNLVKLKIKYRIELINQILCDRHHRDIFSLKIYLVIIILFGSCYGAVMGSYGGWSGDQKWQVLFSAIKVPLLLLFTFGISIPSFYVINLLLGLHSDFKFVFKGLLEAQAGFAVVLASLAPYTIFWYQSFDHYGNAILFNGLLFGISSFTGHFFLKRSYRLLIRKNQSHLWTKRIWIILYSFVGIQAGWILRPFIGDPQLSPEFIRTETWSNAYVVVFNLLWNSVHNLF